MNAIRIRPIPLDGKLVRRILSVLDKYGETGPVKESTFLGIAKKTGLDLNDRRSHNKLRLHLYHMEQEGLVEERHFNGSCAVDYGLEKPGMELLKQED